MTENRDSPSDGAEPWPRSHTQKIGRIKIFYKEADGKCIKWSAFIGGYGDRRTGDFHSKWRFCH